MNDITFFILRHVNNKQSNILWINCYISIRQYYNNKIIIIDDNSNKEYLSELELTNTEIVESEFKGAGEILPYYYFYKMRPSNKMIFLHDSMFIIDKLNEIKINKVKTYSYLFYFTKLKYYKKDDTLYYFKKLKKNDILIKLFLKSNWVGCFGVTSVITLDFLNKIQYYYNFFNLLNHINDRIGRMCLERIFAILCYSLTSQNNYLINDIFTNKGDWLVNINNYTKYINIWKEKSPIIKLWNNR